MVSEVLHPLRGGRPCYVVRDGPLDTPCWLWQGSLNSQGYAIRRTEATGHFLVHRAVLGTLKPGEQAHHRCETRACVNPAHLEPLTHLDHARTHAGPDSRAALILTALAEKPQRLTEIDVVVRAAGHSTGAAMALLRMARRGEVVRVSRGLYALPPESRAREPEAVTPLKERDQSVA